MKFYNKQMESFKALGATGNLKERSGKAKPFLGNTPADFHWNAETIRHVAGGTKYTVAESGFTTASYRPFHKQHLYFNQHLNSRTGKFAEIYPSYDAANIGIAITATGANVPFHALMTDSIVDTHMNADTIYFPRWRYTPCEKALGKSNGLERASNINPAALAEFRDYYGNQSITDDNLFYYTYGVLHSQQYRGTFANDLSKVPVRIPMAASLQGFRAFAEAGRELGDLHVNYETVEPYPLDEIHGEGWNPDAPNAYCVEKMAYSGKSPNRDKTRIIYNAGITLAGIPERAHEYQLGSRSALDWLIDRYQVRTHSASGIMNDPNDWATELGEPRYILDLIKRVTTVSLRTVDIVKGLPELPI